MNDNPIKYQFIDLDTFENRTEWGESHIGFYECLDIEHNTLSAYRDKVTLVLRNYVFEYNRFGNGGNEYFHGICTDESEFITKSLTVAEKLSESQKIFVLIFTTCVMEGKWHQFDHKLKSLTIGAGNDRHTFVLVTPKDKSSHKLKLAIGEWAKDKENVIYTYNPSDEL